MIIDVIFVIIDVIYHQNLGSGAKASYLGLSHATALQAISGRVHMKIYSRDSWFGGDRRQDQSTG